MRRVVAGVGLAVTVAVTSVLGTGASRASAPPTTTVAVAPTTTVAAPTTIGPAPTTAVAPGPTLEQVRAAKIGWAWFVASNFATPTAVLDPCPLAPAESVAAAVAAHGLVPSARPSGVALYRDTVGTGIVGIVCGVDLAASADPAGSTGYAVEVALLDGQAVFPQYVTRVQGSNTPIVRSAELGGETAAHCRNEPTVCVASWHRDGLVVTVRLDGPRTDASVDQSHRVLLAIVPAVLAGLAAVPSPG